MCKKRPARALLKTGPVAARAFIVYYTILLYYIRILCTQVREYIVLTRPSKLVYKNATHMYVYV